MERAEVRVVVGFAAVPAEDDEAAKALRQADRAEPAFDHGRLLFEREPRRAARRSPQAVHIDSGANTRPEPAAQGVLDRLVPGRRQRLAHEPGTEEEPQCVDEHERRQRVLLEIVKEIVAESEPAGARGVALQMAALVRPHCLVDGVLWREQDWTQRKPLIAVERLVIHGDAEESGVAVGLVASLRLDMAADRLGPNIDAEDDLCPRTGPGVAGIGVRRPVSRKSAHEPETIRVFVGFEPDRAMPIVGERVKPAEQVSTAARRQLASLIRHQSDELREAEQRPRAPADRSSLAMRRIAGSGQAPVLLEMPAPIGDQRRDGSLDVPESLAQRLGELDFVEQSNRQVVDKIGLVALLSRVCRVVSEPADEAAPPRQLRQMP